jgi:hypothetical protein
MRSMKSRIAVLQRRIERIKRKLLELGDLRPGTLSEQYNVCGNPRCRCKDKPPQKHGPYYQLSWSREGKSTTRFIRSPSLAAVQAQVRNYHELRKLVDEWIDASLELCDLQLRRDRQDGSATQQG